MIGETILHYKILEKLGEGGMGVVYKAEDTKLSRTVALKFLPGQISSDKTAKERFLIEAKAAAGLNHPNIATIYSIEESDEGMFIVMEYVDGQTLKRKIETDPFTISEAFEFARQVADGLHTAHKNGVVHRDIKTPNLMVTQDGTAKIMDFGLAKLAEGSLLTKDGTTLGTAAYMSPEQARGDKVDHKTDIWSFGVVLYEMLCGQRPFKGEYEQAVMYSIMNTDPEPITEKMPKLPEGIESLFDKIFQKKPEERIRTFQEVKEELSILQESSPTEVSTSRSKISPSAKAQTTQITVDIHRTFSKRSIYSVVAVLAVVLFVGYQWILPMFSGSNDAIQSIAILPFVNVTGVEDNDYLSDGIPESLINNLQKIPNLKLTSFNAVLREYSDAIPAAGKVRDDFNVQAVVMGRMTLEGDDITINIEIVDTRDNSVILSKRYFEKLGSLFAMEESIASDITENLAIELTGEMRQEVFTIKTIDPEAYTNYLKGRNFYNKRTPNDFEMALEYFNKAIETDPDFALAYTGLVDTYYLQQAYAGIPWERNLGRARDAVDKAIALDPNLAEAHASLGNVILMEGGGLEAGIEAYERSIELNPGYLPAYFWAANRHRGNNNWPKTIELGEKALELDPRSPEIAGRLANDYLRFSNLERAIEIHDNNIKLNPDHPAPYRAYGDMLSLEGRHEEAVAIAQKAYSIDSLSLTANRNLGTVYTRARMYDEAVDLYTGMILNNPDFEVPAYIELGRTFEAEGNYDQALESYLKALDIDPNNPSTYFNLANISRRMGDYDNLVAYLKKRLDLNQNHSQYLNFYSIALSVVGRHEEAIEVSRRSLAISETARDNLGYANYWARNFDVALENFNIAIANEPENLYLMRWLYRTYFTMVMYDESLEWLHNNWKGAGIPNLDVHYNRAKESVTGEINRDAVSLYIRGIFEESEKSNRRINDIHRAELATYMGDFDMAFAALNGWIGNIAFPATIQSATYDDLRSDPRFDELIKKMKLEKYIK